MKEIHLMRFTPQQEAEIIRIRNQIMEIGKKSKTPTDFLIFTYAVESCVFDNLAFLAGAQITKENIK